MCRSDLAFNYKLGRKLGAGASAEVFEATHIITDNQVAIKVFTDSRSETIHAACAEFVCAMRSASPSALQYFELAFLKGKPALVMELGEQALEDWIKARMPFMTPQDLGVSMYTGLHYVRTAHVL